MQKEYVKAEHLMLARVGRMVEADNHEMFIVSDNSAIVIGGKERTIGDDWQPLSETLVDTDSLIMFQDEVDSCACRFGLFRDPCDERYCVVDAVFQRVSTLYL